MGPALQAAFLAMQDFGGKLLLFQSAVPSLGVHRSPLVTYPLSTNSRPHKCSPFSQSHSVLSALTLQ